MSSEKATSTETTVTPKVDLAAEQGVGGWEWILLTVIVAGSLYYLFGKYFSKKKSKSNGCGCSGCGQKNSCPSSTT